MLPNLEKYDILPIIPPNPTGKRKPGRPKNPSNIRDLRRHIIYTIDYRGIHDNELTFLFIGAGYSLLRRVFLSLTGPSKVFSGLHIELTHACCYRNGKAYYREEVTPRGYDSNIMSLPELCVFIEARLQQECQCYVRKWSIDAFLNA